MVLPVDSQKNFDLYAEFNRLSWWQRGVSKFFSSIMTLFCQNYEASLRSWVGRFRKIESTDKSRASELAKKVDAASDDLKPKDTPASPPPTPPSPKLSDVANKVDTASDDLKPKDTPASPSSRTVPNKTKRRKQRSISAEVIAKAPPKEKVITVEDAKERVLNEFFFDEANLNAVRWIVNSQDSQEHKITKLFDVYVQKNNYLITSPFTDELDVQVKIREFVEVNIKSFDVPRSTRPYPKDVEAGVTAVFDVQGGMLISYKTRDEGSCGFHAILGNPQNGQFICNAQEERNAICDRLLKGEQREQLEISLTNIFINFQFAPSDYRSAVKRYYDEYHEGYRSLSNDEQKARLAAFIRDPRVINSFVYKLRDIKVFLDQPELITVALMSKKRLVLWQQGWYNDKDKMVRSDIHGSEGEIVHVLFSHAHYERARFVEDLKP